jgi:hypothetical protein
MPEAHAIGALGRAFARADFQVFHQVPCPGRQAVGHVDLLAVSKGRSTCVAVEGKRLYDGRGCGALLEDWDRLGRVHLVSEWGSPKVKHHFRMLVTTGWQENIRDWWMGTTEKPKGRRHEAWELSSSEDQRRSDGWCEDSD